MIRSKSLLKLACIGLLCVGLFSCVSNKKYLNMKGNAAKLRSDSIRLAGQVNNLQGQLGQAENQNREANKTITENEEQIAAQQERLKQLQSLINLQRKNTEALRKKIADALVNFGANELTVSQKNGKVYVSMQESLLFPSGSATVNARGKEALSTLASALNQNPDINVLVEGHTDSIPISKTYQDNLALSVARSTAISRILIKDYSVSAARITSSGRGESEPVASNSTPEGRALNRRTEIILEPKLDELMNLINTSSQ
jgi:chemotaxis protein MotB